MAAPRQSVNPHGSPRTCIMLLTSGGASASMCGLDKGPASAACRPCFWPGPCRRGSRVARSASRLPSRADGHTGRTSRPDPGSTSCCCCCCCSNADIPEAAAARDAPAVAASGGSISCCCCCSRSCCCCCAEPSGGPSVWQMRRQHSGLTGANAARAPSHLHDGEGGAGDPLRGGG